MSVVNLLDCTLRDGGHTIQSEFGSSVIRSIINNLVRAGVDIVEVGFLRDEPYSEDRAVFNDINQAKQFVKEYSGKKTTFSLLAQEDQYDARKLPQNDGVIDLIRVSFHINDRKEGFEFCRTALQKGYKVSCNPINIMGYSDAELLQLIEEVNEVKPTIFSIVDTFGSMQKNDLNRILGILMHNLLPEIDLGIHLHENMCQSFSLAQQMLGINLNGRNLVVDASLRGMGRVPGNLPIELIADYMNKQCGKSYDLDYILDAIENHINFYFNRIHWGYDPIYSLAAQYNLHRTYAEFLKDTGKLGAKDIKNILASIPDSKKVLYDKEFISNCYQKYMDVEVKDEEVISNFTQLFSEKKVLVLANGRSIKEHKADIDAFLAQNPESIILSSNFYCDMWECDYAFFSNIRRYAACLAKQPKKTILTSNVSREAVGDEILVSYKRLALAEKEGDNALFMMLNFLKDCCVKDIYLAGFDGYSLDGKDYYSNAFDTGFHPEKINEQIKYMLNKYFNDSGIIFLTPSKYEKVE